MAIEPKNVGNGPLAGVPVTVGFPRHPLNPPAPARFATFTMDSFGISNTRSRHNDTDFVYLSAMVGANPIVSVSKSMGDVNNGTHSVGLSLEIDIPDDDTPVVFYYQIINGLGGNDAKAKAAQGALNTVAEEIVKHKAITAAAVTVGTVLVPLFVSALGAVAGITRSGPPAVCGLRWPSCRRLHCLSPAATSSRERPRVKRLRRTQTMPVQFTRRLRLQLAVFHCMYDYDGAFDPDCLGFERRMGQRRGRGAIYLRDRKFDLHRHVRVASPHGQRLGSRQYPNLGQLPRRSRRPTRAPYRRPMLSSGRTTRSGRKSRRSRR